MKKKLQIVHIVSIIISVLATLLLLKFSDSQNDGFRQIFDLLIYLVSGSWSSLIIIHLLITENSGNILNSIINVYKRLLNKYWFLTASNSVLIIFFLLSCYQLVFFRQVTFITQNDSIIMMKTNSLKYEEIGATKSNTDFPIRINVDNSGYRIVIKDKLNGSITPLKLIVPYYWNHTDNIIISN